jgi:hypothetical protein
MTKVKEKEAPVKEMATKTEPVASASEITKQDVETIGQIFDLAKKACLDNDNLLVQVVSYKQVFINKLSSYVQEVSK